MILFGTTPKGSIWRLIDPVRLYETPARKTNVIHGYTMICPNTPIIDLGEKHMERESCAMGVYEIYYKVLATTQPAHNKYKTLKVGWITGTAAVNSLVPYEGCLS